MVADRTARGAIAYVTLEPCAHASSRGPCCAHSLIAAGVSRVVVALRDPDPRTDGSGIAPLRGAGLSVENCALADEARAALAPRWSRATTGRTYVGRASVRDSVVPSS